MTRDDVIRKVLADTHEDDQKANQIQSIVKRLERQNAIMATGLGLISGILSGTLRYDTETGKIHM